MSYRVDMARSASRRLTEELPGAVAIACLEFILGPLAENPQRVGAPLNEPFAGEWRAGRGDYRVRYTINDDAGVVVVLDVAHRRDAYRH
ncbi:MAG TPA: type II toxin-antitoxin system RelE/ParE family toxin [Acidimicrobiales bacterium]|nr:type II toxin-antitoxin system RelE/ParE family toxin [Acidimicrobiales bacterium]